MLLTFPSARAAGTSILAGAGVLSIAAGLAAQASLANLIAGLQLAFTDAIRVDDVARGRPGHRARAGGRPDLTTPGQRRPVARGSEPSSCGTQNSTAADTAVASRKPPTPLPST
ncbi:MAG: MscS Mechanosensitive ion channel [Modestobacter sp.]|nr:MscS Mechanosensitive ion channel [Modestobacter sp.]